jgi:DNA-binding FrmR family transcriptional regulator
VKVFLRIGNELAAATSATKEKGAAVVGVMVRRFCGIDFHPANWIDRGRISVVRMNRMLHHHRLETATPWGYIDGMQADAKTSVLKRLKRIEGQVRGLARMIEDDRYCIDVVTQLSAARAALRRAEDEILADHVAHCVEHAIASGNKSEQRRKVGELIDVLSRSDR